MSTGKPNWARWRNLATVTLKEAIALSLDLEPVNTDAGSSEFHTRLSIAINHIESRGLRARSSGGGAWGGVEHRVILADFRAWGEALSEPFIFPDQFPRADPVVSETFGPIGEPKEAPMRSDARENLLRVIRALYEKANFRDHEAVSDVVQMLESLGFNGPKEDTVRKLLKEARDMQPDTKGK